MTAPDAVPAAVPPPVDTADLAEAERQIRSGRVDLSDMRTWGAYLRTFIAEYDRRGRVEQAAAAYVMGGLCGNHSIPGSTDYRDDYAALGEARRERDTARAEADRLREQVERVGRCGHTPPRIPLARLADRPSCTLPAGHAGFHEDDTQPGSSWGRMHTDPDVEAALAARTATPPAPAPALASVCDTCGHTYNWHATDGACAAMPYFHWCPCVRFVDQPAAAPDVAAGDAATERAEVRDA